MSNSWWLTPAKAMNVQSREEALARQQQLTKPAGSLGQLERVAVQLAGLQGRAKPAVNNLWIAIFAGDHGVVAEGVSAYPQEVTGQMLHNFVSGGAAIRPEAMAKTQQRPKTQQRRGGEPPRRRCQNVVRSLR